MRALVRSDDHGPDVSLTWVRLSGRHRRLRTERSTRIYYVLGGTATFAVGDQPQFEVRADDAVTIPRGTSYEFWGEMTYLVINAPAFMDGDDFYEPT